MATADEHLTGGRNGMTVAAGHGASPPYGTIPPGSNTSPGAHRGSVPHGTATPAGAPDGAGSRDEPREPAGRNGARQGALHGTTPHRREVRHLTVLSGPSGVGKSTVVAELRRAHPEVWLSVSVTTRPPRPGETNGLQYHFVDDAGFDRLVAGGELLEWAEFAGNRYGTPRAPVVDKLAAGIPVLLEIDLQGARQVRAAMADALLVFLAPPSWEELVRRLVGRGTEPTEVIDQRLEAARIELAAEKEFDVTLINTSVGNVCRELLALMAVH